ncbi:hypothetical protein HHI36_003623 [Cryptolaemus montrouzieri]|uniref:Uncharacterized protein n=1 Tax=Cryptolaemus montrouzieri TaxID=559131 RepID=A0ABD2PEF7_9CUCU
MKDSRNRSRSPIRSNSTRNSRNTNKKMASKSKSGNKQQQKQQQKEVKKATSGGFPVKTFLFLFTVLGAVIYADVETSGSWKDSNTALLLKKYHVCEYSHKVINTTRDGIRWVNSEIDKQFPGYEQKLHETLEPYGEMLSDVGVISYNIASNTKNAFLVGVGTVITKIEEQAPGLVENTVDGIRTVLKNTVNFTKRSANYLKEEVFVGKLAPEHVGKVIVEALNTTQQMVNQYYVWAYEKVRTVIK